MALSHIPVHPNQLKRFYMNVHGHLHTNLVLHENGEQDFRYFNASVEHHNLTPVPLDEVYSFWAENQKS